MILRALSKPAQNTEKVSTGLLAGLAPFRHQPPSLLAEMAAQSQRIRVPVGLWSPDEIVESAYFLLKGRMQIESRDQVQHRLQANSPAAAFPLPVGENWCIHVGRDAEVVRVPARHLALQGTSGTRQPITREEHSDLYQAFSQTLKNDDRQLPTLPDLALRIGKAIEDPNIKNADIARLIQLDPSLAARVMSVVNSAAFRAIEPVQSLQQAISRLGHRQVRNLVFSFIIKGLFRSDSALLNKRMQTLWRNSCRVAAISFVLANLTPGLDPNRALLAGLVHDIGTIPVLKAARKHPEVARDARLLDELIADFKAEVGALILSEWHFDQELVDLVRHAEHWHRLGTAVPDYLDVVLLAQLHAFIGQGVRDNLPRIDQIPAFNKLALGRLTPNLSIAVLERSATDIREIVDILQHG